MDLIQKANNLGFVIKNKEYHLWEIQKWLREKHNLIVIVYLHKEKRVSGIIYKYSFLVHYENNILGLASYTDGTLYETYEQAFEQGLQGGLKLISINLY